ncbi:MAG: winged helix-turn-helix domain-containing protein [Myxococcota bacterium]
MADRLRLGHRVVDLDTGEVEGVGQLRPMERALLAFLVLHADQAFPIHELHTAVWGYAPQVRSRTAYSTIARLRALIEPEPDAPRFLIADRGTGYRLVGAVRIVGPSASPSPPAASGPFVGRRDELAVFAADDARVLAVIGPGGAGKTRLALEAAGRSRAGTPEGGAWWCNLEHARDRRGFATAVASVIPGGAPDVDVLGDRIAALGPCRIVLDDADGVGPELAAILPTWLARAPEARFVVTSRVGTWIPGERVIEVGPLPLDDALALYRDRLVRLAGPGRGVDGDAAIAIALVDRVDRLPLGIEIVAGNAVLIGEHGTLDALDQHRSLPNRGATGRHGSLHAVVAWSWDRLPEEHRDALADLAVLDGGFGIAAAEAVLDRPDAVDVVAVLVDASLIAARTARDAVSFRLFDVVRAFVRQTRPRDDEAVLDRLVAYVVRLHPDPSLDQRTHLGITSATSPPRDLSAPTYAAILARVEASAGPSPWATDEVRFRVRRRAVLAAVGVRDDWVRDWLEAGIASGPADHRAYFRLCRAFGRQLTDPAGAIADHEALVTGPMPTDPTFRVYCRRYYGHLLCNLGRLDDAQIQVDAIRLEARALPTDLRDRALATALFLRSTIDHARGDPEGSLAAIGEAGDAMRRAGDLAEAAGFDASRARSLLQLGRLDQAAPLLEGALHHLPIHLRAGWCATELAAIRRLEGRPHEAHTLAIRALPHHRSRSPSGLLLEALIVAAACASGLGRWDEVVALIDEALALPPSNRIQRVHQAALRAKRAAALGPAWTAVPLAERARALSDELGGGPTRATVAVLDAELKLASGELEAAARAIDGVFPADRSLDGRTAGLLAAELALRLGDRDQVAALTEAVLDGPAFPVELARAYGLRALLAALDGDRDAASRAIGRTTGVHGLGEGWLAVHRRWVAHLLGRVADPDPDPDGVDLGPDATGDPRLPLPDEFAARWALDEARSGRARWAG